MIHEAKRLLVDGGADLVARLEDSTGLYAYLVRIEGTTFYLVAKAYADEGRISVMEEIVYRGVGGGTLILWYNDDDDLANFLVVDPRWLREHGTPSTGRSKTREVDWLEVDADAAVSLTDYIARRERPKVPDGTETTYLWEFEDG